jgi:hypothetical protein
MLPPLKRTDPPFVPLRNDMNTAPPLCTPPPASASAPIGIPCQAHLSCGGIGDRHRHERCAAAGHVYDTTIANLHTSAAEGCPVNTNSMTKKMQQKRRATASTPHHVHAA